jgi:hypothetical protein
VLVSPGIKKILPVIQWDLSVIRIRPFPSIATGQPIRWSIMNSWGTWTYWQEELHSLFSPPSHSEPIFDYRRDPIAED